MYRKTKAKIEIVLNGRNGVLSDYCRWLGGDRRPMLVPNEPGNYNVGEFTALRVWETDSCQRNPRITPPPFSGNVGEQTYHQYLRCLARHVLA